MQVMHDASMPAPSAGSIKRLRWVWQYAALLVVLAWGTASLACQLTPRTDDEDASIEVAASNPQADQGLVIQNDSELPVGYPHRFYELRFLARAATTGLHWKVVKGPLPPGLRLEDNGLLHGEPASGGEFQFTVSVAEGGRMESAVQKSFFLKVITALALSWKNPAHVNGNRIEGSVEVTNTTPDDMDLTFIVLAVAGNGRATAIGYQHFLLRRGTVAMELPFGDTLPHGGYVVHVDAVGEVVPQKLIYRERMQTAGALQVTVGP